MARKSLKVSTAAQSKHRHLGVTLADHSDKGALITAIDPADLMAAVGLRAGDVLLSVNQCEVNGHAEALGALESAMGKDISIVYKSMPNGHADDADKAVTASSRSWSTQLCLLAGGGVIAAYAACAYQGAATSAVGQPDSCAAFVSTLTTDGLNRPIQPMSRTDEMRCNASAMASGPIVYDTVPTLFKSEGIGSRLSQHKISLIVANALRAPWAGVLWNGHDDLDYASFFGLGAPGCSTTFHDPSTIDSMWGKTTQWVNMEARALAPCATASESLPPPVHATHALNEADIKRLCEDVEQCTSSPASHPFLTRALEASPSSTVVAVKDYIGRQNYFYCAFASHTRKLFHTARVARGRVASKPPRAVWIGVHIRWGDTGNVKEKRWGVSLEQKLAELADVVLGVRNGAALRGRPVEVGLFSEGNATAFLPFVTRVVDGGMGGMTLSLGDSELVPGKRMMELQPRFLKARDGEQSGRSTQDDFDKLAQSDVLIGDATSFFAAAAHMCVACVVISEPTHGFFKYEGPRRPPHHQLLPIAGFEAAAFDAAWQRLEGERHKASCE